MFIIDAVKNKHTHTMLLFSVDHDFVCKLVARNFWFVIVARLDMRSTTFRREKSRKTDTNSFQSEIVEFIYNFLRRHNKDIHGSYRKYSNYLPNCVVVLLCKHNPKCVSVIHYIELKRYIVCLKYDLFIHQIAWNNAHISYDQIE